MNKCSSGVTTHRGVCIGGGCGRLVWRHWRESVQHSPAGIGPYPVPCPPLQILHMESLILNTLGFRLAVVTPKHFMKRFTTAAGSDEKEIQLVNVRVMCFGRSLPSPTPVYSAS